MEFADTAPEQNTLTTLRREKLMVFCEDKGRTNSGNSDLCSKAELAPEQNTYREKEVEPTNT